MGSVETLLSSTIVLGLKKTIRLLWPFSDLFLGMLGVTLEELDLLRFDARFDGAAILIFDLEIIFGTADEGVGA